MQYRLKASRSIIDHRRKIKRVRSHHRDRVCEADTIIETNEPVNQIGRHGNDDNGRMKVKGNQYSNSLLIIIILFTAVNEDSTET